MSANFAEREVSRNVNIEEVRVSGLKHIRVAAQPPRMGTSHHIHLRAHRKASRLTQEQVANILGVKNNTVSGWESGARTLDLEDLERLAKIYGVHPAALLFAPDQGARAEAMRHASEIAGGMDEDAVREWLAVGQRMKGPTPA